MIQEPEKFPDAGVSPPLQAGDSNPLPYVKLMVILALALLLRSLLFWVVLQHPERALRPDTNHYLRTAFNCLAGNGFSSESHAPFTPDTFRTPVYPLFVAGIFAVCGHHPMAVLVVQVALSVATVGMVFLLGRRLLPTCASLWAALLFALSLGSITYAVLLLTETLFTFLMLAALWALLVTREQKQWAWLLASGLLAGAAVLCRPIAIFLPVVALPVIAMDTRPAGGCFAKNAAIWVFGVSLVVLPWMIRNHALLGTPALSSVSNYNLLFYNAAVLEASRSGRDPATVRRELSDQVDNSIRAGGRQVSAAEKNHHHRKLALQIMKTDPAGALWISIKSNWVSLLPNFPELLEILGVAQGGRGTLSVLVQKGPRAALNNYLGDSTWNRPLPLLLMALFLCVWILTGGAALWGAGLLLNKRNWRGLCLLGLPVLFLLLLPGPASTARFRVPAMPFLALLSGYAITAVRDKTESVAQGIAVQGVTIR